MAVETHASHPADLPPSAVTWLPHAGTAPAEPDDLPTEEVVILRPPIPWPRVFPSI